MNDNEKEVVSEFLTLAKFAILAILVASGYASSQLLL